MTKQHIDWCGPEYDYVLALVDVRGFKEMTAAALRACREGRPNGTQYAFAMIGSSFTARVSMDMLSRALRFLSRGTVLFRYCEDEPSALAWLAEVRPEIQAAFRANL